ncbi:MAG TPA: anti-sigma factor [Actinomycetes bacterium]|nr:anti-sigma factor [Actinomycetes bacterium]
MTPDPHMLTGAYAADALPDTERAAFERHLANCPDCEQEVRELQATTAQLGLAAAEPVPDRVWQQISERIERTRQLPPLPADGGSRRLLRRWSGRLLAAAAALLLVAVVALGKVTIDLRNQVDQAEQAADQAAAVLAAPDATVSGAEPGSAVPARVVVSRSHDAAVFAASGLPPPPSARTYQLWFLDAGHARSAGLLPERDSGAAKLVTGLGEADTIAMTVEPEGGSPQPTTDPTLVFDLTA